MLVSLTTVLKEAERGNYAVIAPNFYNLLSARSLLKTANEMRAPLILSYNPSFQEFMDVPVPDDYFSMIRKMIDDVSVPVVLHLDHGGTLNDVTNAIDFGFSSVMFDGSMLLYEENVRQTRSVVEKAQNLGISVEAELGHVGSGDSNLSGKVEHSENLDDSVMTDPIKAKQFVEETGVDALAVSIGTVHGYQKTGSPKIDFDRLEKINAVVPVPLVLHGGSGVSPNDIRKAILLGIRKINVWSDLMREVKSEMKTQLEDPLSGPGELVKAVKLSMGRVLRDHIELSGSHRTFKFD